MTKYVTPTNGESHTERCYIYTICWATAVANLSKRRHAGFNLYLTTKNHTAAITASIANAIATTIANAIANAIATTTSKHSMFGVVVGGFRLCIM